MNSIDLDFSNEPIERAKTIPSHWYTSPEFYQNEIKKIFNSNWVFATHKNQLEQTSEIRVKVGTEPIIIILNENQEIKAFYDVCKHRGGPLCIRIGTKSVLQCQYHGWTYTSDGHLRGVPEFDRVELFDKKDFGLTANETFEFMGLIFVNLNSVDSGNNIQAIKSEVIADISPIDFSTYQFQKRISYPINCNWKIYIDNYLEGYHIPHVHPELNKLLDYRTYKTRTSKWHSLQYSQLKAEDSFYGKPDDMAFYYFIFPNCMLNILPGRLQTNFVEPIDAEHCIVHFDYYYDKSVYDTERIQQDIDYSEFVQREDEDICQQVQVRLHSSSYSQGRFSVKCEQGVYHFQQLLKKMINER